MNRLGRYVFYWLAASAVLALISRSGLIRRVPFKVIGAAATGRALRAHDLLLLPPPDKKLRRAPRRRTPPRRRTRPAS
jgi:hypothetical protein